MSYHPKQKLSGRMRRRVRVRKKVSGTAERPRLSVFRSANHIYAQVIDDKGHATLAAASSVGKELKGSLSGDKTARAKAVGEAVGKVCKDKGIEKVTFDRNGYNYHGRVKAVADGARSAGLQF